MYDVSCGIGCYNCKERHPKCHSNCEKYFQYTQIKDVIKRKRQEYKILDKVRYSKYGRKY